jgi:methylenetetrahydrofolate dehydrogenase (NADP+) / methenyltetrahydrofolate cyclohydrolase
MGHGRVLNGTEIANEIKAEVKAEVGRLALQGIRPGLAAVLVGHVPASEIYVRSKVKTCESLGLAAISSLRRKRSPPRRCWP